jgi:hypothetical protein
MARALHAKTQQASDKEAWTSRRWLHFARLQSQHCDGKQRANIHSPAPFLGAANIGDAGKKGTSRADKDVIPEAAVRPSSENTDYHTGRGGAGNAHIVPGAEKKVSGDGSPLSLADKLKAKIFGRFSKK